MTSKRILVFENSHSLCNFFLKEWVSLTETAIKQKGRFVAALSGGKAPIEFFCKLSNVTDHTLWNDTHLFLADERYLPLDDDQSNYSVINETLLESVPMPQENIYPIPVDQENVSLAAYQYERLIKKFFALRDGEVPMFDMLHLGLGEDGHIASLFPGDTAIKETNHLAIPTSSKNHPFERVTLTLPVLNNARHIYFIITGQRKAEIVKKVLEDRDKQYPATYISPSHGSVTYLLDKAAADKLPYRESFIDRGLAIEYISN